MKLFQKYIYTTEHCNSYSRNIAVNLHDKLPSLDVNQSDCLKANAKQLCPHVTHLCVSQGQF